MKQADRISETVVSAEVDLDIMAAERSGWGLFRDRRPTLYAPLLTHDGVHSTNRS